MKKTDFKIIIIIRNTNMEEILYKEIATGNYFVVSNNHRGLSYSIALKLGTFNQQFIKNDSLNGANKFIQLELNEDNLNLILRELGANLDLINLDDFNNYNYIKFKETIIRVNNWNDFSNFISKLI